MVGWSGINQEEADECWMKIAGKIKEEVPNKFKVEDSKREAYKGRGPLLEWRQQDIPATQLGVKTAGQ